MIEILPGSEYTDELKKVCDTLSEPFPGYWASLKEVPQLVQLVFRKKGDEEFTEVVSGSDAYQTKLTHLREDKPPSP
jgi:hypothetical protein